MKITYKENSIEIQRVVRSALEFISNLLGLIKRKVDMTSIQWLILAVIFFILGYIHWGLFGIILGAGCICIWLYRSKKEKPVKRYHKS